MDRFEKICRIIYIVINALAILIVIVALCTWFIMHTIPKETRREQLQKEGYNEKQCDSIISKEDSELTTAYLLMAG